MPEIPFKAIAKAILDRADYLVPSWLPDGKRQGDEWVSRNPNREDQKPGSFSVNLKTGVWKEFAGTEGGADLVSLYAFLFTNGNQKEAALDLAKEAGIELQKAPAKAPAPHPAPSVALRAPAPPATHPGLGQHTGEWIYRDRTGSELYRVRRFDTPDGKEYRPLSIQGGRWEWRYPMEPRPLYGLDRRADPAKATVLVVEGEKAADAGARLFPSLAVVTSPAGAKGAGKADWAPLRDHSVVIWPDHDAPGLEYAGEVYALLKALGVTARVVDVPDHWPAKWDLADAPPPGISPADLQEMILRAQPWAGDAPAQEAKRRPLIDLLVTGSELARMQIPPREMIVAPFLATGSLNMVTATRGLGKTFFGMELSKSVTLGQAFFEWQVPAARNVLFLDGEMPTEMLQERFLFLYQDRISDRLAILPSEALWTKDKPLNLNDPESQDRIQGLLDDLTARGQKPALVIIDNLSSMSFGTDENDNSLQDSILRWLMGLRHQGYAVLLVHHAGKNGEQRGASRREDFLDTSIRLTKPETETQGEGAAFKIEFTKERGRKANPSTLSVALETGEHGEPVWARLRAFPEYMRALLVIRDQHPASVTELGKLMDISRQAAAKHVEKLRNLYYLRREDLGLTQKGSKVLSLSCPSEAA